MDMGDGNDNLSFNREIDVMKKLDHPFIIKLYEEFLENNH
jgi:serine/threonine protein kinase